MSDETITYGTVLRYGTSDWTVMVVEVGMRDGRPVIYMTTLKSDPIASQSVYQPGEVFPWLMGQGAWQVVE